MKPIYNDGSLSNQSIKVQFSLAILPVAVAKRLKFTSTFKCPLNTKQDPQVTIILGKEHASETRQAQPLNTTALMDCVNDMTTQSSSKAVLGCIQDDTG